MSASVKSNSKNIFEASCKVIPGGVNSPVRACKSVGAEPKIVSHGQGGRIFDVDGCAYVDLVCSWGPLILGHGWQGMNDAVSRALADGAGQCP